MSLQGLCDEQSSQLTLRSTRRGESISPCDRAFSESNVVFEHGGGEVEAATAAAKRTGMVLSNEEAAIPKSKVGLKSKATFIAIE